MLEWVFQINRKYDLLDKPHPLRRFFIAMLPLWVCIAGFQLALFNDKPWLAVFFMIWPVLMAAGRVWYFREAERRKRA